MELENVGKNALPKHLNSLHQINDTSDIIMNMPALKTDVSNDAIDLSLKVIRSYTAAIFATKPSKICTCYFIYYRAAAINK